ncbi:nuclear transport factor 2 family protein [Parashewanella spongiae]|uniref:Nuclear transport factor 2 family protein n=1 Tax=Parashewanella spongiae TaxID=342950 RepID=A0A3A6TK26_9GAMM|nr:DUF4440 domain-containing protein [Parashewanella spongiae]MCL1078774.1 nuclear transport factor 2 family protein [Parashewanella spongiae]RJY12224.1 nuclear transport factor 2 family protein [Parashewanella spongiae]
MLDITDNIIQLEKSLFTEKVRASKSKLNTLIADDFIEVASTGARFGKTEVLNRLPDESTFIVKTSSFEGRVLSNDSVMLVYQSAFKRGEDELIIKEPSATISIYPIELN